MANNSYLEAAAFHAVRVIESLSGNIFEDCQMSLQARVGKFWSFKHVVMAVNIKKQWLS